MELPRFAPFAFVVCFGLIHMVAGETQLQTQDSRRLSLQSKETTPVDFVRLFVMRLIFGIASAMGLGENLSNFLGGIFVPPGADYDDDYDIVPDLF